MGSMLLLGSLMLADVRNRAAEFHVARWIVCRGMTYDSDVFDGIIRHQQPMIEIKSLPFLRDAIDYTPDQRSVFRMSSLEYEFQCRFVTWVVFKYSIGFLRPINFSA